MFEIKGKYTTATVYADITDSKAVEQIQTLCNQEFAQGQQIRIMPDVHAGAGCTIGTTMTIKDKIVPNLVGVDIGCGMSVAILKEKDIDLQKLDDVIRKHIPSGRSIHDKVIDTYLPLDNLACPHVDVLRAYKSIGTLGGGNHFIEVDKDDDGTLYLIIHSGSRHLGVEVANWYQNLAYKECTNGSKTERELLIASLKATGREKEIDTQLKALRASKQNKIPKELAYLEGYAFDDYIHDMEIVESFASYSRIGMLSFILLRMNLHIQGVIHTIHNYIDTERMILRKGAVSAEKHQRLIIPINMRDGSLICIGKGNPEWNYSAPHGAGRLMSRSEAKDAFSVSEFKKEMDGVFTTSVGQATLDECPMAYKPIESILANIKETVDVKKIIKPIYNFKASS